MSRFAFAAAVLLASAPAFAQQPPAGNAMPPELQQAAMAFGQCVRGGIAGVAATVTPEAGAASVMSGCATQRQALERTVETMIASMPEAERTAAREQMRTQLAQAEAQVAAAIRQSRAAPATGN